MMKGITCTASSEYSKEEKLDLRCRQENILSSGLKIQYLLLISLAISACSSEPPRKRDEASKTVNAQEGRATDPIPKRLPLPEFARILKCSPQFIGPGDVIHVEDRDPLGEGVAIIRPGAEEEVLNAPDWSDDFRPPIDSAFLKNSNKLDIPVSQVSRGGATENDYTFKETGFYRLVFGINDDFPATDFPAYAKAYCDLYYDAAQRVVGKNTRMPKPPGWNWILDDPEDQLRRPS